VLASLLFTQAATALDHQVPASSDDSIIHAFQNMCGSVRLNLEQIEHRATAGGMRLQSDKSLPGADSSVTRTRTWFSGRTSVPSVLIVDTVSRPQATLTGCAVLGKISDPAVFRTELIDKLGLVGPGTPGEEAGHQEFQWSGFAGPDTSLVVMSLSSNSVMVKLFSTGPAAH
jgi:hypothetical protein